MDENVYRFAISALREEFLREKEKERKKERKK